MFLFNCHNNKTGLEFKLAVLNKWTKSPLIENKDQIKTAWDLQSFEQAYCIIKLIAQPTSFLYCSALRRSSSTCSTISLSFFSTRRTCFVDCCLSLTGRKSSLV